MVADQADVQTGEPEVVPMADFRKFQSAKDQEIADIKRRHDEERRFNDDLNRELAEHREELAALKAQGYANDDPEMVKLRQDNDRLKREVKSRDRVLEDFGPRVKDALVKAAVLEHGSGDPKIQDSIKAYLNVAKTNGELETRIQAVREWAVTAKVPAPGRDEVDAGRGTGRSGGVRYTRALLNEHMHDTEWRKEHMSKVEAFIRQTGGLPER